MLIDHSTSLAKSPLDAEDAQSWTPEVLQDILGWLSAEQQAAIQSSPAASSSCDSEAYASSGPSTNPSFDTVLDRCWHPCTLNDSIGDFLDARRYPVSYRTLIHRWQQAGCPALQTLRIPLDLGMRSDLPLDLRHITDAQERGVIDAVQGYFAHGITPSPLSFAGFASHLHIYAAVYAELEAVQFDYSYEQQIQSYQQTWRSLLDTFVSERSCSQQRQHDCFYRLLWGEAQSMAVDELTRRFIIDSSRSNGESSKAAAAYQVHSPTLPRGLLPPYALPTLGQPTPPPSAGLHSDATEQQDARSWSGNDVLSLTLTLQQLTKSIARDVAGAPASNMLSYPINALEEEQHTSTTPACPPRPLLTTTASDPNALWMQQYRRLLKEAALQLNTTAEMLDTTISRPRSSSTDEQQWQQQLPRSRSVTFS